MATRTVQPRAVAQTVAQPAYPELLPFLGVLGDAQAPTVQAPVRRDVDYDAPMNPFPLFIFLGLVFFTIDIAFLYAVKLGMGF